MQFSITSEVAEKYPSLMIGMIVMSGMDNTKSIPEITELLRAEETRVDALTKEHASCEVR